jgi:ankyrin repeat protein
LISAVQQRRMDTVRRLCEDFNAALRPMRLSADALLAAAECGNAEALAYFAREQRQEVDFVMLGCGAPVPGRPNFERDTLIQRAAQLGHLPVVRLLAEELYATYHGSQAAAAYSVAASLAARPLLHCAIASGNVALVRYVVQTLHANLEEEGMCDAVYPGPVPPLHAAGLRGDVPLLRFFVREAGLAPDMAEPQRVASGWRNGLTLLHWVAWLPAEQRWPVFDCLVNELGADKHATDVRGYDALQDALTRGGSDTEPIRFLVDDCGYDPAAARYRTERWGERLLSLEALSRYNPCREAVLRMLLERGADASARTVRGITVAEELLQSFHARSGTPQLVRLLVQHGCPIPSRAALPAAERSKPGKYPTAAVVAGRRAFTWSRRAHLAVAVTDRRRHLCR